MKAKRMFVFSTIVLIMGATLTAGSLEPSGAPAPTMKTLDEVEPRIPIPGSDAAVSKFTIDQSGSYYMTGNRTCSGVGIEVKASDVTIDLMGYTLKGPDTGTSNHGIGISSLSAYNNLTVRNGTIRDFSTGIYHNVIGSYGHCIENVRVISNLSHGIHLTSGSSVKNCIVSDNGTGSSASVRGIKVTSKSTVTNNVVFNNGTSATSSVLGISVGDNSMVSFNTVFENGAQCGGNASGISTGNGCTVISNTVYNNAAACGGFFSGIGAASGCTIAQNTVYENGNDADGLWAYGISASNNSSIIDNTVYGNGAFASIAAGITTGTGSLIARNVSNNNGGSASGNVRGIEAGTGSTVIDNTAYGNGTSGAGTGHGIYLFADCMANRNTAVNNDDVNMNTPGSGLILNNHAP